MRAIFGVLSLVVVLLVVGLLAKRQLASTQQTGPVPALPAATSVNDMAAGEGTTVQQQTQRVQQQYKEAIDSALRQAQPLPEGQ